MVPYCVLFTHKVCSLHSTHNLCFVLFTSSSKITWLFKRFVGMGNICIDLCYIRETYLLKNNSVVDSIIY